MNAIQILKSLGPIDIRSVRRDSMLNWMALIPLISALLIRLAIPPITARLIERYGFDLTPYYPIIMAYFFTLMTPLVFGMVIGFLLLDERDDGTLTALQVTPIPLNSYLAYRIIVPLLLSIILMFITYPIINMGNLGFRPLLITTVAAAPMAPLFAVTFASIAENKVQGFALMKASGVILLPPMFAFFIESKWELALGLFPTY